MTTASFLPMLKEIDDTVARCFKAYDGYLGTHQPDYEEALERYRTDMIDIMEINFSSEGHRSAEEKQIHEDIKAHTYGWLLDARQDHFQMPLMTGHMMDRVWKESNTERWLHRGECNSRRRKRTNHVLVVCELASVS